MILFCYVIETSSTMEGYFYIGSNVGDNRGSFWSKLGWLDFTYGNTDVHELRFEIWNC